MKAAIIGLIMFLSVYAVAEAEELATAINDGRVTAKFISTGGGSGGTVYIIVAKTSHATAGRLRLTIAPGTRLRCVNDAYSDVIVEKLGSRVTEPVKEVISVPSDESSDVAAMVLTDTKPIKYFLWVFSVDAVKASAPFKMLYTLEPKDHAFAAILNEANNAHLSGEETQVAIWIYTNNLSFESLPILTHANDHLKWPFPRSRWYRALSVVEAFHERENPPPDFPTATVVYGSPYKSPRGSVPPPLPSLMIMGYWRIGTDRDSGATSLKPSQDGEIEREIDALARNREVVPLPPATSISQPGDVWNGVLVKNQTPYTLRVLYSGPVQKVATVAPGSEQQVDIPPGQYRVGVKVLGGNVAGLYGNVNYNPASRPVHTYFMKPSR